MRHTPTPISEYVRSLSFRSGNNKLFLYCHEDAASGQCIFRSLSHDFIAADSAKEISTCDVALLFKFAKEISTYVVALLFNSAR